MCITNYFDQKRGWKKFSHSETYRELLDLFWEEIHYAQTIGIFPENTDDIDFYLVTTSKAIASCWHHKYGSGELDLAFCFNARVVAEIPTHRLREIVIHEVAHACSLGDHHGPKWQRMAQRLGKRWGFTYFERTEQCAAINAVMRQQKIEKAKYRVTCPACGASWLRQKACGMVTRPQTYTCGCGWKGLEVTEL